VLLASFLDGINISDGRLQLAQFVQPKNTSRRTMDLPHRTLEALRTHRKTSSRRSLGQAHTKTLTSFSPHERVPR
jgi:hypothetical protein